MGRQSISLVAAALASIVVFSSSSPAWAWGTRRGPGAVRAAPPDQTWVNDVPPHQGGRPKGRVAVFVFTGDDVYEPVRAAVVKTLRRKGLEVTATLHPVDSPAQYREMSIALNVGVYVDGELTGEGGRQTARVRLRSGVTGQPMASATYSGPTTKIVGAIERTLWGRLGSATLRACSSASRPRRREREPLRIQAGTPLEAGPHVASQGS